MGEPPVRLGTARDWLCHVCGALNLPACRVYFWYWATVPVCVRAT